MKRLILLSALAAVTLFYACTEEKAPVTDEVDMKLSVRMVDIAGRSAAWKAGDIVYFSDNISSRPGFQFTASEGNINSAILNAVYKKASPEADTVYAVHAPKGRIRKRVTEAIDMAYDGTLAGSAVPFGTGLTGSKELVLSPMLPVAEFSIKSEDVAIVRIMADKDVFPTSFKYNFASSEIEDMKARPAVEVSVSGEGPFYLPLVAGSITVGFSVDLFTEGGFSIATATIAPVQINAVAGGVVELGMLDKDATIAGEGGGEELEKASQAILNMRPGVNLDGSFEVLWKEFAAQADRSNPSFYERQNGCGLTTQATMDAIAAAGFRSVRIPVTWWPHMDDPFTGNTIDKVWLDRIEEVVNYCQNANLYCFINMMSDAHAHEAQGGTWLYADMKNYDKISKAYKEIWEQIATRFKDYDHRLIFESYNEISDASGTWTFPRDADDINAANKLNQDFVNTVRRTGGNNTTRNLIVSSYSCSVSERPLQAFVMPTDLREGHLIWQVHNYAPTSFCGFNTATSETFGTDQHYADIQAALGLIKTLIVDKGWPCVIGEYGAPSEHQTQQQQPDGSWRIPIPEEERAKHAYYYTLEALKIGVAPMFWYTPMDGPGRTQGIWNYPKVKDALIKAWNDFNNNQ